MKAKQERKRLTFGDLIEGGHRACGKRRALGIIRLAAKARLIVFQGHGPFVISRGKRENGSNAPFRGRCSGKASQWGNTPRLMPPSRHGFPAYNYRRMKDDRIWHAGEPVGADARGGNPPRRILVVDDTMDIHASSGEVWIRHKSSSSVKKTSLTGNRIRLGMPLLSVNCTPGEQLTR